MEEQKMVSKKMVSKTIRLEAELLKKIEGRAREEKESTGYRTGHLVTSSSVIRSILRRYFE